jgi:hypothetical protein
MHVAKSIVLSRSQLDQKDFQILYPVRRYWSSTSALG